MSVHSRPSIQYQDGMELRDKKMTKDCTQPLRIGNIRALNGCAGRLFGAATLHNHKNSANKSNRKAMIRNWSNQKANPALKTKREIYPTKKETHTVAFSNFLENNNKFSYFILFILLFSMLIEQCIL